MSTRGFLSQPRRPRYPKGASGGAFDITTLTSYVAAYSFKLADGKLIKDLGSSGATANGDAIAKVKEWSSNGRDLVNTNGTDKPLVATNGLQFDGIDDYLSSLGFNGGSALSELTIGIRFSIDSAPAVQANGSRVWSWNGGGFDYTSLGGLSTIQYPDNQSQFSYFTIYDASGAFTANLMTDPSNVQSAYSTFHTIIFIYSTTNGGWYVDGQGKRAYNLGSCSKTLTNLTLAAYTNNTTLSGGFAPITVTRMYVQATAATGTEAANGKTWLEA